MADQPQVRDSKPRETGTAGQPGDEPLHPATSLPPDPQLLGRPMTPDEQVDEASLESMDGSDAPAFTPTRAGRPRRAAEARESPAQVRQAQPR
jgi:hypothetical protein